MVNWTMFQPRNLFVIGVISAVAYFIYNHFSKGSAN